MIRRLHLLLAAFLALAGAAPATALAATPAEPAPGAQNCARASLSAAPEHTGASTTESPSTHPGSDAAQPKLAAGCCVATKGGDDVPVVNWGHQQKHFLGHKRYVQGRSELTADPRRLIERAGMGQPANKVPRGEPGFRERVDFGERIGTYVDPVTGTQSPTTRGLLHYSKRGVHVVPARPGE